ncbi:MAG TPA: hypothetical protein PLP47_01715 [Methanofastidiosum sp.]|nr:hypothetical protein [Methanofastidiosum sp.]HOG73633.1 hypothetical protein [Methanofastidiosum sp.]HRZ19242.1 hypothetical protein [Methanofastidiosum sp.]
MSTIMGKDNDSPIIIFRKECIKIGILDNNREENSDIFCLLENIPEGITLEDKIKKFKSDRAKLQFESFCRKKFERILQRSFENSEPENDLEFKIYKSIQELFNEYKANILNNNIKQKEEREKVFKEVRLSQDVPEFIGEDMKSYGPYKKGEIVSIPLRNAEILIREKIAEN